MTDEEKIDALLNGDRGLRESLALLYDSKVAYEESENKAGAATLLVTSALYAAARAVGEDAMQSALGAAPTPDAPREDHLRHLAQRLFLVDCFLPGNRTAPSSFDAAMTELEALARGDEPRLFAQIGRYRGNTYRACKHKMRALMWDAFLRCTTDMKPGEVQTKVGAAFGAAPATYKAWEKPVRRELGEKEYGALMDMATGEYRGLMMAGDLQTAMERLARDGRAYQADQRREAFGPVL